MAGDTIEVILSLIGFNGVVRIVKFVFKNKDTLYKVLNSLKCFFVNNDKAIFFADGLKNLFLNISIM